MTINTEWILNKNKERIYPVTHAKATVRGNSTVDEDLTMLEQRMQELQEEVNKLNVDEVNSHINKQLNSEEGVHGFRYINDELQFWNGATWVIIETGGASGIAPHDMKSVSVATGIKANQLFLKGEDPDDTVVNGVVVSKWQGTKIVRKVGSYPTRPSDGVLVCHYQTRNQYKDNAFVDSGLVPGEKYYYTWFPYSDQNVVNKTTNTSVNHGVGVPTGSSIVGVTVDLTSNTFTRTDKAVGLNAGADFDQFTMYGGRRRCIVTDDRVILAYYGDAAYTETGHLTKNVIKDEKTYPVGTNVQVMVYQPKFYFKVTPVTTENNPHGTGKLVRSATYQLAEKKYEGYNVHPAFINGSKELPYVLLSAYEATTQDYGGDYVLDGMAMGNRLASVAGAKPVTGAVGEFRRGTARGMAGMRGDGWGISDIMTVSATQLLFMVEYATMNSQTAISRGVVDLNVSSGYSGIVSTGTTATLGNSSGIAPGVIGKCSISYRGEENVWGNTSCFVDGINIKNSGEGIAYVSTLRNYLDDTTVSPYFSTGSNLGRSKGYISAFAYSIDAPMLFLPCEVLGDSSNPVGDYYQNPDVSAEKITFPTWGGTFADGNSAGLFNLSCDNGSSKVDAFVGARLVCIPE